MESKKSIKPIKLKKIETVSFVKLGSREVEEKGFMGRIGNKSFVMFYFALFVFAGLAHTYLQFKIRDTEITLNKLTNKARQLKSDYNVLVADIENLKRPARVKEYVKAELNMIDSQPYEIKKLAVPERLLAKYEKHAVDKEIRDARYRETEVALGEKCLNKLGDFMEISEAKESK